MANNNLEHCLHDQNSKYKIKRNLFFYLYIIFVFLLMIIPAEIVPRYLAYVTFFLLFMISFCLVIFDSRGINKSGIYVFFPLILMVLIVSFSHLKGVLLGIKLSANDFSDYLKFLMPPMIALGAYKVCDNGGGNALISLFRAVSLVYAIFFLGYIFWGAGFVYSIGLGRGRRNITDMAAWIIIPMRMQL